MWPQGVHEMVLPELMCKIWDGDANEYFTWLDMNRVEYNANIIARESGVSQVSFIETARTSQFRYDEAQKLENLLKAVATKLGKNITIESAWGAGRTVSYVDFERWESNFWTLYTALGGTGSRIPAGKVLVTYSAVLYASRWSGSGPYYQDLEMPGIFTTTDALFYVSHTASMDARMAEYNGVLRAGTQSDRLVRVYALGLKPQVDIPVKVSIGGLAMYTELNISASSWTGSGPWTATVTLPKSPVNATLGTWPGMSDTAVEVMTNAIMSVSAMSGSTVTLRCLGEKPTMDLNPMLIWEDDASE